MSVWSGREGCSSPAPRPSSEVPSLGLFLVLAETSRHSSLVYTLSSILLPLGRYASDLIPGSVCPFVLVIVLMIGSSIVLHISFAVVIWLYI